MKTPADAKIIHTELQFSGSFLKQAVHTWLDPNGKEHKWEYCMRHNKNGAVAIIALLKPSNRVVLIEQFRPPINAISWEFPAGLIDDNETIEQAAIRELNEECGLMGVIVKTHPPSCSSPGMTNETIALVEIHVDETLEENQNPQTHFDASECIITHRIPLAELSDFIQEKITKGQCVDAKLYAFTTALNLSVNR